MIKMMDNIYAVRIMYILLKPFNQQKSYKLGLIDESGNEIREPKTEEEQLSYTLLHKVAFELKKLISKMPGNEYRIKQIATALQILHRKNIPSEYMKGITEEFLDIKIQYLKQLDFLLEHNISLIEEEYLIEKNIDKVISMTEEGVINSVSGVAPSAGEEPVINSKLKNKKGEVDDSIIVTR